jgi:hypothetical protein
MGTADLPERLTSFRFSPRGADEDATKVHREVRDRQLGLTCGDLGIEHYGGRANVTRTETTTS